jgi:hypothetical protein
MYNNAAPVTNKHTQEINIGKLILAQTIGLLQCIEW